MKIGIVSDAHGNATGLSACIAFFIKNNIQTIFFLGDAVGYLPDWKGVLDLLKAHSIQCVMGNHEAMLLDLLPLSEERDLVYGIRKNKINLTMHELEYIAQWNPYLEKTLHQKKILFCHGSPDNYLCGYVYPDTDISHFEKLNYDIIFLGHSHYPFIRQINNLTIVNAGSCGLPRDTGNMSSCAIYDLAENRCQIFRIPFDANSLIEKYKDSIDASVMKCLLRKCETNFFGKVVEL